MTKFAVLIAALVVSACGSSVEHYRIISNDAGVDSGVDSGVDADTEETTRCSPLGGNCGAECVTTDDGNCMITTCTGKEPFKAPLVGFDGGC